MGCIGHAAGFIPTPGHFFFMFLVFFLAITMFTYLGQFLVFLTPSQGLGQILASGEPHLPPVPALFPDTSICACIPPKPSYSVRSPARVIRLPA